MDISKMQVPLKGAAKIFKARLKSKTWDIHGMPHFITTTHHEGCDMCEVHASHVIEAYTSHIIEASKVPTVEIPHREVQKAFQIAWPKIVHYIEDKVSS